MNSFTFFLLLLLLLSLTSNSQYKYSKSKNDSEKKSIEIIRRFFLEFIKYEDGLDSKENKETMKRAIKSLPDAINKMNYHYLLMFGCIMTPRISQQEI